MLSYHNKQCGNFFAAMLIVTFFSSYFCFNCFFLKDFFFYFLVISEIQIYNQTIKLFNKVFKYFTYQVTKTLLAVYAVYQKLTVTCQNYKTKRTKRIKAFVLKNNYCIQSNLNYAKL